MAYDSQQGLYYNFNIKEKDRDFNPSYCAYIEFRHSIFDLYPFGTFTLVNKENILYQEGLSTIGATVTAQFGIQKDDENMDEFKDLIIEKVQISDAKPSLEGNLIFVLTHKSKPIFNIPSEAKGWADTLSSDIISELVQDLVTKTDIEATSTKGNWLKPSSQSSQDTLRLLKNRSLPSNSDLSKMFMWIDLGGTFHFKSLAAMLSQEPIMEIDLTDGNASSFFFITDFDYNDNGIRYSVFDTNNGFQEYTCPAKDADPGLGELVALEKPTIKKANGDSSTGIDDNQEYNTQKLLYGYSHNQLPTDYNKAHYINNIYNFPYRLSFTSKNFVDIAPGQMVNLIFPHNDPDETSDQSTSGKYLVVMVRKREEGLQYINDIYLVSNSRKTPID